MKRACGKIKAWAAAYNGIRLKRSSCNFPVDSVTAKKLHVLQALVLRLDTTDDLLVRMVGGTGFEPVTSTV